MRRPLDQPLLVILFAAGGAAMMLPAGHAAIQGQYAVARGFLYPGLLVVLMAVLMALALQGYRPANVARSHLLQLAAAFVLVPVALAVPLVRVLPGVGLTDAWFEMVSALTTTGATLLDTAALPPSVNLWRAIVGWLGGLLTLVAAVAILAPMNLGGFEVISGQGAGRGAGGALTGPRRTQTVQIARISDPSERMQRFAGQILPVYAGLTVALWLGLTVAGDTALTGLIRAMSTLSSSGISDGGAPATPLAEGLVLICFGFALSRRALPGASARMAWIPLHRDAEFRLALSILFVTTLVLFTYQATGAGRLEGAGAALWAALFTAASFLTSTGFVSAQWAEAALWSGLPVPGLILMGLAIAGGGVATTAGGIKLIRLLVLHAHGVAEMERLLYPHSVGSSGRIARQMRESGAMVAWTFAVMFLAVIVMLMAGLTLTGMGFEPALVLSVAALTNTGPLALVGGALPVPWQQGGTAQAVLAVGMVLGRLETLAFITLLAPSGWRR